MSRESRSGREERRVRLQRRKGRGSNLVWENSIWSHQQITKVKLPETMTYRNKVSSNGHC